MTHYYNGAPCARCQPHVCANCDTDSSTVWHRIGGKDYCEHGCLFVCDGHGELLPVTEQADCAHFELCKGCAAERYCLECERADVFWDAVDRAWDQAKEGAW